MNYLHLSSKISKNGINTTVFLYLEFLLLFLFYVTSYLLCQAEVDKTILIYEITKFMLPSPS